MLGTIGLMMSATDWGRFIYINVVALFLLSLQRPEEEVQVSFLVNPWFIALLSLIYFSAWNIRHVGKMHLNICDHQWANISILFQRLFY